MAEAIFWWVFLLSYGRRGIAVSWCFMVESDIRRLCSTDLLCCTNPDQWLLSWLLEQEL